MDRWAGVAGVVAVYHLRHCALLWWMGEGEGEEKGLYSRTELVPAIEDSKSR